MNRPITPSAAVKALMCGAGIALGLAVIYRVCTVGVQGAGTFAFGALALALIIPSLPDGKAKTGARNGAA